MNGAVWLASTFVAVRSSSFAVMKKLLFLGACLVAFASQPVRAQAGGTDIVLVRFYHVNTVRLHVTIARGTAKPEELDIKGNDAEEAQFCRQVIAKLYQEGYTLKSTFATAIAPSNLLFVKGQ